MVTNDTLPADVRHRYELKKDLKGGPVFAFPQYGGIKVDFSKITLRECERLVRAGYPHLKEKQPVADNPTPSAPALEAVLPAATDTPSAPAPEAVLPAATDAPIQRNKQR